MRGPGLRTSTDVRRLWRCPSCGYERKAHKTETTVSCGCTEPRPQMKLIEGIRRVRPEPRPVARFFEETDLPPDDVPATPAATAPSVPVVPLPVIDAIEEPAAASDAAIPAEAAPPIEPPDASPGPDASPLPEASPGPIAGPSSGKKKRRRRSKGGRRENEPDSDVAEGAS